MSCGCGLHRFGKPTVPRSLVNHARPGGLPGEKYRELVRAAAAPTPHGFGERHWVFHRSITDYTAWPVGAEGVSEDAVFPPDAVGQRVRHGAGKNGHMGKPDRPVREIPRIQRGRFRIRFPGTQSNGENGGGSDARSR